MNDDSHVAVLADHPDLIREVGLLRWQEWGYGDPQPNSWIEVTAREAGRDSLPVTLVAIDPAGHAVGAVALGDADDALTESERQDRTPWLLGMVVRRDDRLAGVGRRLVTALEELAHGRGHGRVWVVTGPLAVDFYRACGWRDEQQIVHAKDGAQGFVLSRTLA